MATYSKSCVQGWAEGGQRGGRGRFPTAGPSKQHRRCILFIKLAKRPLTKMDSPDGCVWPSSNPGMAGKPEAPARRCSGGVGAAPPRPKPVTEAHTLQLPLGQPGPLSPGRPGVFPGPSSGEVHDLQGLWVDGDGARQRHDCAVVAVARLVAAFSTEKRDNHVKRSLSCNVCTPIHKRANTTTPVSSGASCIKAICGSSV